MSWRERGSGHAEVMRAQVSEEVAGVAKLPKLVCASQKVGAARERAQDWDCR
jgi:hypothetical protein